MRGGGGVGGPLLSIGDLLADVGQEDTTIAANVIINTNTRSADVTTIQPSDLPKLYQESYKCLNDALEGTSHSWTAQTLELCMALETANKLIQSSNSHVNEVSQKIKELEKITNKGCKLQQRQIFFKKVCKTRTFALGDKPHSFFAPEGKPPRRGLNPRPLACVISAQARPKSTIGTPAYIAPEVLSRREYYGKVPTLEVLAYGVVAWTQRRVPTVTTIAVTNELGVVAYGVVWTQKRVPTMTNIAVTNKDVGSSKGEEGVSIDFGATMSTSYILNEKGGPKEDECIMYYQSQGVSVWEGAEVGHLQAGVFK
uniref:Uncharacterized protein n=1 Tax=Tanacetum cinerariifolium TaxID=118510 RepID=A0A699H2J6_TANCI|nr:hypothetical protein [Tanacetum cinerariifolium]